MTSTTETLPAETGGTNITRFNALRHEVAEHGPQGPTEEHLVEEIAGILWRKRRLRLAEAAAHQRGRFEVGRPGGGCSEASGEQTALKAAPRRSATAPSEGGQKATGGAHIRYFAPDS